MEATGGVEATGGHGGEGGVEAPGGRGGEGGAGAAGGAGGAGGEAPTPDAPTLELEPTAIKLFRFTWADVSGETEYRLLESVDGASSFVEVASLDADVTAFDHEVFLPGRFNARYVLQACNASGCRDSDEVTVSDSLVGAVGYVKASNTGADDRFGYSVALSADGATLAVGAVGEDGSGTGSGGDQADEAAPDSGAVYVFTRESAGSWSQQGYLKASNTEAGDGFGRSVALSADGGTLAVGADEEASSATGVDGDQADNSAPSSGAVYVFTRDGAGAWSQQAYLKASNTDAGDGFGRSVALSANGTTLAVSAEGEASSTTGVGGNQANDSAPGGGAVYVFARDGAGVWSQQAYIKAFNTEEYDFFGRSVALSADGATLAVSADGEDSDATGVGGDRTNDSAPGSGAVYVYMRNSSGVWSPQAYVKASNTAAGDSFGYSVALSGDGGTLAVSARNEDSGATGIGGDQTDDSAPDSGAVYVFTRDGRGAWSQQAYLKASNTGEYDFFGLSLALSADGGLLAVGASMEDGGATGIGGDEGDDSAPASGAVYVFARSSGVWFQQAYVKASNAAAGASFGRCVALSADGGTLAVGPAREDGNATGIGGDQDDQRAANSGAVYLY